MAEFICITHHLVCNVFRSKKILLVLLIIALASVACADSRQSQAVDSATDINAVATSVPLPEAEIDLPQQTEKSPQTREIEIETPDTRTEDAIPAPTALPTASPEPVQQPAAEPSSQPAEEPAPQPTAESTAYVLQMHSFEEPGLSTPFPDETILKEVKWFGGGGGGGGATIVGTGCLTGHDHHLIPYPEPTILFSPEERPLGLRNPGQSDICVCGYDAGEVLDIVVLDPNQVATWKTQIQVQQSRTSLDQIIEGSYCAEVSIDYEFVPGDPLGEYAIRISGADSKLETTKLVGPQDWPYYSERLGGHIVRGYEPNSKVTLLTYRKTDPSSDFNNYEFQRKMTIQLDGNGMALVETGEGEILLGILTNSPLEDGFSGAGAQNLIDWQALLDRYPDNSFVHYYFGKYFAAGKSDYSAYDSYSRSIELNPSFAPAYLARASTVLFQHPEQAIVDLEKAIELEPDNQDALQNSFHAHMLLEMYDRAVADAGKMIALVSDSPTGYHYRAHAHWQAEHLDDAIADFSRVIEINRENGRFESYALFDYPADAHENRGRLYLQQGNIAAAKDDFRTVMLESHRSPIDNMDLVEIPAGEFIMGSLPDDPGAELADQPQHVVYLDTFLIDRHEVTSVQYALCVEAQECTEREQPAADSEFQFDPYPVVNVNWQDAKDYCEWAGRRLPTEAEWEKAARGVDGRIYPWGNMSPEKSYAHYNAGGVAPVGQITYEMLISYGIFIPLNPYEFIDDMAGNVWEWVSDYYSETYYQESPNENPPGSETGEERVVRGGAWNTGDPIYLRAANRWSHPEEYSSLGVGFRCVISVEE